MLYLVSRIHGSTDTTRVVSAKHDHNGAGLVVRQAARDVVAKSCSIRRESGSCLAGYWNRSLP